ncbi:BTAD domain-containing putative transcriptional regulator [Streptomyces sp. NBC_01483]|uniref:BTAD domain-containing putative transcriptional regulator n=1 Tax=Streptomyces sp. NBC_01483 TaxID=2903883 RepID=UPI002E30373B|nr:BTAD domain-containing putative transcriptional regulator [Streptomyces sp. NBC_01483]
MGIGDTRIRSQGAGQSCQPAARALDALGTRPAESLIRSGKGWYRFVVDGVRLDTADLTERGDKALRTRASGDLAGATDQLSAALALFRGEPLANLPGPFARNERQRLLERRRALRWCRPGTRTPAPDGSSRAGARRRRCRGCRPEAPRRTRTGTSPPPSSPPRSRTADAGRPRGAGSRGGGRAWRAPHRAPSALWGARRAARSAPSARQGRPPLPGRGTPRVPPA